MAVLDEGAFAHPNIIKTNMLPVWLMRGKVIVGISSPAGRNSFFSKLFYATIPSTNRRVFNGYIYEGFCEDCKEKNKMETCSHEPWKYPPWLHISEKMESIRAALGDDMETFNKEQKGLLDDVEKNVYVDPKLVEAMKKRTLFDWTGLEPPKFLVIAADPNQGGECDTAISALCPYNGTTIVSLTIYLLLCGPSAPNSHTVFRSGSNYKLVNHCINFLMTVEQCFTMSAQPFVIPEQE